MRKALNSYPVLRGQKRLQRRDRLQSPERDYCPELLGNWLGIRVVSEEVFSRVVWQNAIQVLPRWSSLMASKPNPQFAS